MDFSAVLDLLGYWVKFPPPHIALHHISQFLGAATKGADEAPSELVRQVQGQQPQQEGNVADLLAMFPGGVISTG